MKKFIALLSCMLFILGSIGTVFADENNEQMMELYSQSITGMVRDIMWPSLISIVEKGGLKMTCFMQPQTNYEDGIEPTSKDLVF